MNPKTPRTVTKIVLCAAGAFGSFAMAQIADGERGEFSLARQDVEEARKHTDDGWNVLKGAEQRREALTPSQVSRVRECLDAGGGRLDSARRRLSSLSDRLAEVRWLSSRAESIEADRDRLAKKLAQASKNAA